MKKKHSFEIANYGSALTSQNNSGFTGWIAAENHNQFILNKNIVHPQVVEEKNWGISCGRDKVVIVWSLATGDKVKTVPVSESVEGMCLASADKLQVSRYSQCCGAGPVLTGSGSNPCGRFRLRLQPMRPVPAPV